MKNNKLHIGIIGFGTVATGVIKVLKSYKDIETDYVAVKNINKKRDLKVKNLINDPKTIANDPKIDVVVELAGGCEIIETLKLAIKNKKHIVTANKELIARYGNELFELAKKNNVAILYEASVAGAIPIITTIKTSLSANKYSLVAGILNGTTNYILSNMESKNLSYKECLKEAQELGYAEANPKNDVEGYDAMYKIAILANLVYKKRIDINKIYREGITKITSFDMKIADELGYKIKLIALAKLADEKTQALDIRVHPMLVSKKRALSSVNGATNAVFLIAHPMDKIMLQGPGAGQFPTSSSVVGDILCLKSEIFNNNDGDSKTILPMMQLCHSEKANQINIKQTKNCYYLSIEALSIPGVIGKIGSSCEKYNINISYVIQKGVLDNKHASVVVITEEAYEKDIDKVIDVLQKNKIKIVNKIRIM